MRPVFSHLLSLIHFWALVNLVFPGSNYHPIRAPIPGWLKFITIAFNVGMSLLTGNHHDSCSDGFRDKAPSCPSAQVHSIGSEEVWHCNDRARQRDKPIKKVEGEQVNFAHIQTHHGSEEDRQAVREFGVYGELWTYLIDSNDKVLVIFQGCTDEHQLAKALKEPLGLHG